MTRIGKIFDRLMDGFVALAAILLLFVTFSITYTILTRVIGIQEPLWIIQFTGYALLWITFLGAAWLLRRKKHVNIDTVTRLFGPKGRAVASLVHGLVGAAVCLVLAWFSLNETISSFQRGIVDVQAVDMPKYLIVGVIPFGFLLLVIQFLRDSTVEVRNLKAGGNTEPSEPGEVKIGF